MGSGEFMLVFLIDWLSGFIFGELNIFLVEEIVLKYLFIGYWCLIVLFCFVMIGGGVMNFLRVEV